MTPRERIKLMVLLANDLHAFHSWDLNSMFEKLDDDK